VGLDALLSLMAANGLRFLKSSGAGAINGPDGLIAANDVALIKINCQWDQRGGTNTDLLRGLIQTIVDHPEGFTGEVIVVDNGQGRGRFTWDNANAEDTGQSAQKVVDSFGSERISTYLWDNIRGTSTQEYDQGSMEDGYILEDKVEASTGMRFSYPKFTTKFGSHISLKKGLWDISAKAFSTGRLKLLNVPVLKSHSGAGVTACIKHYMGVVSQSMVDNHPFIWNGGLAAEMVHIRFPTLNILDATYVNPHPMESGNSGPGTAYSQAVKTNQLFAGLDPIALDYYASKNVLLPAAQSLGYSSYSSLDPDTPNGTFHNYLAKSMEVLSAAGLQATMSPSQIIVHAKAFTYGPLSVSSLISTLLNAPANSVHFILPDYRGPYHTHASKCSRVNPAELSDFSAAGYVLGLLSNPQNQLLDTNPSISQAVCGNPVGLNGTIVALAGPGVNEVVHYYEQVAQISPVYFLWDGVRNNFVVRETGQKHTVPNGVQNTVAGDDLFLLESFVDMQGRDVYLLYGFSWQGTLAAAIFLNTYVSSHLTEFANSWYIYEWKDASSGSSRNNFPDQNDQFTLVATG